MSSFTAESARESSPWLSYARDHLVLLDDGASLAIKEEATGVTLYDRFGSAHRADSRTAGDSRDRRAPACRLEP